MSNSLLYVNGQEINVRAEYALALYRLIYEVVLAGQTETVIVNVQVNGEPAKLVSLVTPSTQTMLVTNDVATMTEPFYTENANELLESYLKPYTDLLADEADS